MNTNFEQSPEWLLSNTKGNIPILEYLKEIINRCFIAKFYYVFNQFIIKQYSL